MLKIKRFAGIPKEASNSFTLCQVNYYNFWTNNNIKRTIPTNNAFIQDQLYKKLQNYQNNQNNPNFPINFNEPCKKTLKMIISQLFIDKHLIQRINSFTQFLQNPIAWRIKYNKQGHNTQLEPNLQNKFYDLITQQKIKIKCSKNLLFNSKQLIRDHFYGLFIHRKLNMNRKCYSVQNISKDQHKNIYKFCMKDKLTRQSDIKQKDQKTKLFESDPFYQNMYRNSYQGFVSQQRIQRRIYRVQTDLRIDYSLPSKNSLIHKKTNFDIGYNRPTVHYFQTQHVYYRYAVQQVFLTDVDFVLNGNPYFSDD